MFATHGTYNAAVSFGGERLSDAVDQYRVMGAGMTVRHQVVGIREACVITAAAIDIRTTVQQIESILVGHGVASRTECAGTECQSQIVFSIGEIAVHGYFACIFVPDEFRCVFRQLCAIADVAACHAVEPHIGIADQCFCRLLCIPARISVACLACKEVGKGGILVGCRSVFFTAVAEADVFAFGRAGKGERLSGIPIPGMQ